jgi:signal transduction histidine kinase
LLSQFRWITDLSAIFAVLIDSGDGFVLAEASRGWLAELKLSRAGAVGRKLNEIYLTENASRLQSAARRALSSGKPVHVSLSMRGGDQLAFTARPASPEQSVVVVEARQPPQPYHLAAWPADTLFEHLSRARALIAGGVFYSYELGRQSELGPAKLLGYPKGHPATRRGGFPELYHPDDLSKVLAHQSELAALSDRQFSVMVCRMRHIDGDWRWIEARERVVGRSEAGMARRILGFASDVSERYRLLATLTAASKALLTAESHERERVARELHDSMAQHLVAIDLTLSRLERRMGGDPAQLDIVHEIRTALEGAHREVRTLSYLLHPPELERLGFEASLRKFLHGFGLRARLNVRLHAQEHWPVLDSVRQLALFRVAQEALMNVHKHAGAQSVDVRLCGSGGDVVLEVSDDGVGLSQREIDALLAQQWGGVGIAGMTARMEQLGGRLEIRPRPKGLLIRARLPIAAGDHEQARRP